MTNASHDVFVDRRTDDERDNGLATQILYWYDLDKKNRRRINGVAVDAEGNLAVARSTCSKKDHFIKAHGRMIVARRLLGGAQRHAWTLRVDIAPEQFGDADAMATACAAAYGEMFPGDEKGHKRAYNAGKVFARYRQEIDRRASELLDGFGNDAPAN